MSANSISAGSPTLTHVAVEGREATPRAIAAALHGWRATAESPTVGATQQRPWSPKFREFGFWLGVAVAFASVALAFLLYRSKGRQGVAYR